MATSEQLELTEILEEVRRIEVMSNRLVTDVMAGGYSSVFRGAGIEFDEVREYVEGDDPRSVDWNVTARVGRPFVKRFVEERELTVLFLLDLSASMASGGFGAWSCRQMAARVCSCLALSAVKNQDKVGLITFREDVSRYVPPGKSIRHALRIVRECLAKPVASPGHGTSLRAALELAGRVRRRRTVMFVVSDFVSTGWQEAMAACGRRHDVIAVRLLPIELQGWPESARLVRVQDPESGRTAIIDWRNQAQRAAFTERIAAWQARTDADLNRADVDRIDVAVPREPDLDAVARPILEFFRTRELRGAKR